MLGSRSYRAISEIYFFDRLEIVDVRKVLLEWSPGGQQFQERASGLGLYDQSSSLFARHHLGPRKLEIPHRLVAAITEETDSSLGLHGILPPARAYPPEYT